MLDLEAKKEWLAKIGVLLPPTGKSGASSSGGAAPAGSAAPVGGAAPAAPTYRHSRAPWTIRLICARGGDRVRQMHAVGDPAARRAASAECARADFATALAKVKAAKKAEADAEQARRELMWSIAITIALMPAGPVVEAAANAVAGPALQSKMMVVALANNAANLEAKFGAKGARPPTRRSISWRGCGDQPRQEVRCREGQVGARGGNGRAAGQGGCEIRRQFRQGHLRGELPRRDAQIGQRFRCTILYSNVIYHQELQRGAGLLQLLLLTAARHLRGGADAAGRRYAKRGCRRVGQERGDRRVEHGRADRQGGRHREGVGVWAHPLPISSAS